MIEIHLEEAEAVALQWVGDEVPTTSWEEKNPPLSRPVDEDDEELVSEPTGAATSEESGKNSSDGDGAAADKDPGVEETGENGSGEEQIACERRP